MPEKPHQPEPLDSHDPYPRRIEDGPDPMAERRRNSAGFYAEVDAAIAARPAQPSYITRTVTLPDGGTLITYDNGRDTALEIHRDERGVRVAARVDGSTVILDLGAFTVDVLTSVLREVLGTRVAPITGSR